MYNNSGLFRRKPPLKSPRPRWIWCLTTTLMMGCLSLYLWHIGSKLIDRLAATTSSSETLSDDLVGPLRKNPNLRRTAADTEIPAEQGTHVKRTVAVAPSQQKVIAAVSNPTPEQLVAAPPAVPAAKAAVPVEPVDNASIVNLADQHVAVKQLDAAVVPQQQRKKALIFTMDSITEYVRNAKSGGPAGEILIRESLEWGLRALGVDPVVATSDAEFADLTRDASQYDLFFFDPWTFVSPGWKPRPFLLGREARSFCLSFFGIKEPGYGWNIPPSHILTPYPFTFNAGISFLGYVMEQRWLPRTEGTVAAAAAAAGGGDRQLQLVAAGVSRLGPGWPRPLPVKKKQGVIWGKKASYFAGREALLAAIASEVELHSTAQGGLEGIPAVVLHGPLTRDEWHTLLAESKFMLGLGDPLIGPSALDAVAAGAVFINPTFSTPHLDFFASQHPYLQSVVGEPYVCNANLDDQAAVLACVRHALTLDLPPRVIDDMTPEAYLERLRALMEPALGSPALGTS